MSKNEHDPKDQDNNKISACGKCRAMGKPPPCLGHKGGSGTGEGDDEENTLTRFKQITKKYPLIASTYTPILDKKVFSPQLDKNNKVLIQLLLDENNSINYEEGLLFVESNRPDRKLVFRVKPGLPIDDTDASIEYLEAVNNEFDKFKDKLTRQRISVENFNASIDRQENKLTIHLPDAKSYDALIKYLESKNLLPLPNTDQQEKPGKKYSSPFDISQGPRPPGVTKKTK